MLFSSIEFLFYFLPVTVLCYFCVPKRARNAILLFASLFFYFWGEPRYGFLMVFAILAGYLFGRLIENASTDQGRKLWKNLSVFVSLLNLGVFKYYDFFAQGFGAVLGIETTLLHLALPLGISFYTFQMISYTVDVYRGETPAQHNLIDFAMYIALFPQLVAGPIVRYQTIQTQLRERMHSFEQAAAGGSRFVFGLAKKVLLANALGELITKISGLPVSSVAGTWIMAVSFTLQIYYDFSGYSDMAIGLGQLFGFHFPENFRYPYLAKNITEFWHRWHMSLSTWFRDYVYIPLGGNRVVRWKWIRNVLIVWMCTGFWHGASYNFIMWGLYFALFLLLEKAIPRLSSHLYTLLVIVVGFVIFDHTSISEGLLTLRTMAGLSGVTGSTAQTWYYLKSYAGLLLLSVIGATPLIKNTGSWIMDHCKWKIIPQVLQIVALLSLLILVTAYLVDGSFNPFLYFRF